MPPSHPSLAHVSVEELITSLSSFRQRVALIKGSWLEQVIFLPQGAFYALIDLSLSRIPSVELAKKLLDSAGVAFTPGIAFGDNMDGYLRMCFATSEENIEQAINALSDYL